MDGDLHSYVASGMDDIILRIVNKDKHQDGCRRGGGWIEILALRKRDLTDDGIGYHSYFNHSWDLWNWESFEEDSFWDMMSPEGFRELFIREGELWDE